MPDAPKLRTAVEHATARVPVAGPDDEVGAVRAALAGRSFDSAHDVAVLVDEELVGVLPLERLLAADEQARVRDVMGAGPPVVGWDADQQAVAWEMVRCGESSVAVSTRTAVLPGWSRRAEWCACCQSSTTKM